MRHHLRDGGARRPKGEVVERVGRNTQMQVREEVRVAQSWRGSSPGGTRIPGNRRGAILIIGVIRVGVGESSPSSPFLHLNSLCSTFQTLTLPGLLSSPNGITFPHPPATRNAQRRSSFKNWFLGTAMLDKHKKARGNAEAEEAQRERESEKARREREYRHNVRAWKGGRTDVHLW